MFVASYLLLALKQHTILDVHEVLRIHSCPVSLAKLCKVISNLDLDFQMDVRIFKTGVFSARSLPKIEAMS